MVNPSGRRLDTEMLRILRLRQRLTQHQVAQAADISAVHYRRIETGAANASEELIAALAEILETTPARLHAIYEKT